MKEKNKNICRALFDELVYNIVDSELEQSNEIREHNRYGYGDIALLCILDPIPTILNDEEYFRVNRIIIDHSGKHYNFNTNLSGIGINIFTKWCYNLEYQEYLVYYYSTCLDTHYCPPTIENIIETLRLSVNEIRKDKLEEFKTLMKFIDKGIELTRRINRLRWKIHDKRVRNYF